MAMSNPPATNGLTWRNLNKEGCELGRATRKDLDDLAEKVKCIDHKIDRMTWALVAAAITFGTAALTMALNLIF